MSLAEVVGPGRAAKAVEHSYAGGLTPEDTERLAEPRGIRPSPLKRMHNRHHTLAKALACGMTNVQAHAVTGYDIGYISIMRKDPAFAALVSQYNGETNEAFVDVKDRMTMLLTEIVNIVQARVEDDPDSVGVDTANEFIKTLADRTGHAPVTKSQSIVGHIDIAAAMQAAREKILAR